MIKTGQKSDRIKSFEILSEIKKSGLDRRTFLWQMAIASSAAILPITACNTNSRPFVVSGRDSKIFSKKQWEILIAVQDILFPSEDNSPGAREINAAGWVQWVVADRELDPAERDFLKNNLNRVDEEALERWEKPFLDLKEDEREKLLRHIETHSWGESWLSVMLLRIFEALLSDPIYGGNSKENGWLWLSHNPGQPRPKEDKIYGNFVLTNQETG